MSEKKHRYIDLTGQRFNRWLVIERNMSYVGIGVSRWKCVCDCGKVKEAVMYTSLVRGMSQSCGCLRNELIMKDDKVVHSHRNPVYSVWMSIKTRCFNEKHPSYVNYGARGITMAEEWRHDFDAFLAHVGDRPEGASLDRIDNNKGYEPGNVRWSGRCQQAGNTRRNIKVSWRGFVCNLIDVARMEDCNYLTMRAHFKRNGSVEAAVARCKQLGSRFEERAREKLGIPSPVRKSKPQVKLQPRKYWRPEDKDDNPGLKLPAYEETRRNLEAAKVLWEKAQEERKFESVAMRRRRENKDKVIWGRMERCRKMGVTYRGELPSDFNDKLLTTEIPKIDPKACIGA